MKEPQESSFLQLIKTQTHTLPYTRTGNALNV